MYHIALVSFSCPWDPLLILEMSADLPGLQATNEDKGRSKAYELPCLRLRGAFRFLISYLHMFFHSTGRVHAVLSEGQNVSLRPAVHELAQV